jgi:putative glycosyltransferase (TIGR04348 family)
VRTVWDGEPDDALVVLHARRGHASVRRWRRERPRAPLVVVLTGTDVYGDLGRSASARASLAAATRVVLLQPLAVRELPPAARAKARTIRQSAVAPPGGARPAAPGFPVAVVGHLRGVKDPLRPALAARRLPASSRVTVLQAGAALTPALERKARAEEARNPRYRWLGSLSHRRTLRLVAGCRLLVHPSRLEGGANAVVEAVVAGVPVLASRVPGNVGLLGRSHPGLFRLGDTGALARLLSRAETDRAFYARLVAATRRTAAAFRPARERAAWASLLREVAADAPAGEDGPRWRRARSHAGRSSARRRSSRPAAR